MPNQQNSHPKEAHLYNLAKILERAAYYGFRSLVVLYMISESINMSNQEALYVYGWFTSALVFSPMLGALLGDLLIGNKKTLLLGGILQALGFFSLCMDTTTGLYTGLFLAVVGAGLYTPNLSANFGKFYLNKTKLLDAGFSLFYLAANIGAFFGVMCIGYTGENFGWSFGFILSGVLMLTSLIPILFSKEVSAQESSNQEFSFNKKALNLLIAILSIAIFWAFYDMSSGHFLTLQSKLIESSLTSLPQSIWQSLNAVFIIPLTIIAAILWTYSYSSQIFKLSLGFIFGAIGYGILFLIPESLVSQHLYFYIGSVFFLSVSETYLAPVIHSMLTEYVNPKYLAISMSLVFVPNRLFTFLVGFFNEEFYENPSQAILIGVLVLTILSIGLLVYYRGTKKWDRNQV